MIFELFNYHFINKYSKTLKEKPAKSNVCKMIASPFTKIIVGGVIFTSILCCQCVMAQTRVFPESPVLTYPSAGADLQFPAPGTKIPFSWEAVEGATGYSVTVSKNHFPVAIVSTEGTNIEIDLNLTIDDIGKLVYWSVNSISGNVISTQPSISSFSFSLDGTPIPNLDPSAKPVPLPAPSLIIPENGSNISAIEQLNIIFRWSEVSGASAYRLIVYKDNQPLIDNVVNSTQNIGHFQQPVFDILQWEVRSIDLNGISGLAGMRNYFTIGKGVLPTPTPSPIDADIDNNGKLDIRDIYQFASRFATNDPEVDMDNSGLNEKSDLLRFIEMFVAAKQ